VSYSNILDCIGATPLIRLENLGNGQIFAKAEMLNPGGSVKDRVAKHAIEGAERRGLLKPGGTIIEATSGNTGIGLAFVGVRKGYRVVLVMPENMSEERKKVIAVFGAECVLTSAEGSLEEALHTAYRLRDEIPGSWVCQQFENPDNPEVHYLGTGREIFEQMQGRVECRLGRHPGGRGALPQGEAARCAHRGRGAKERIRLARTRARAAPDPGHRRRIHPHCVGYDDHQSCRRSHR
jgi:cysteine synthase A